MSPPTTGQQKGQKRSGVSVGKPFFSFLSERGDCKYFKACMSVRKCFHAKNRISDLPMVNLEWNMTQKPDPALEPSNYKHPPKIRMLSADNSICLRFVRDGPELLHTCSTCMSIPRPYLRGALFIFAEYIWSYVVRTYMCIHVSKKSAKSLSSLGATHFGHSASFIVAFH